jgi:hypothetical protein
MTFHAQALVHTARASEYAAKIAGELAHEFDTEWAAESGVIALPDGVCDMHTWPEGLRLDAFAESREGLARIEDVVRHQLQRAGAAESLSVEWRLRPTFSLS